jgi:hypothetical protein
MKQKTIIDQNKCTNPIELIKFVKDNVLQGNLEQDDIIFYLAKNYIGNLIENYIPYYNNNLSTIQLITMAVLHFMLVSPKIIALIIMFL